MRPINADELKELYSGDGLYTAAHFRTAIDEMPTASPWHSIEEPPEEYGYYVVYRPYFPWTKAKYCWENGENKWYSLKGEILCPTHWMPVELPKEDV